MTISRSSALLIALVFLASCSGASSSTSPVAATGPGGSQPVGGASSARTGAVVVNADVRTLAADRRSPKFIGSGVTAVAYQFYSTGGSTSNEPAGTVHPSCSSGGNCTFTIPNIPAASYGGLELSLIATISATPTTIGSGFTVNSSDTTGNTGGADSYAPVQTPSTLTSNPSIYTFSVAASATTSLSDVFAPVDAAPSISFSQTYTSTPTYFFVDGTSGTQNVTMAINEVDPAGNPIATANGAVANYPSLTSQTADGFVSASPGTVSTAPATSAGTTVTFSYAGTSTTSAPTETVTVHDGLGGSTTTTIPFVSLGVVAGGTGGYVDPNVYVNASQTVTLAVTEANAYDIGTGGSPNKDAFTSTTTCMSSAFTVADDESSPQTVGTGPTTTPFDGNTGNTAGHGAGPTSGSPNGTVTYTVSGVAPTGTCALTIASATDSNLALTFDISANTGNVTIHNSSIVRKH